MTGNKINWQDLAAELATRTGMQRKDADAFVRAFFDTLGKEIKEEKSVKVKALGTFKMVEVQERESVNVNTGERFIISGHAKIGFLPDTALKELVNKPFADFQTVILNEGITAEDMERIDRKYPASDADEEADDEVPPIAVSSEPAPAASDPEAKPEEPAAAEPEAGNAPSPYAAPATPAAPTEETAIAPAPAEESEAQEEEPETKEEEPATAIVPEPGTPEQPEPTAPAAEEKNEEAASKEPVEVAPIVTAPQPQAEAKPEEAQEKHAVPAPAVPAEKAEAAVVPNSGHNIWRTLFLTLVVLLLMLSCYMAGYLRLINMSWLCLPPAEDGTEIPAEVAPEQKPAPAAAQAEATQPAQTTETPSEKAVEKPSEKPAESSKQDAQAATTPASTQASKPETEIQKPARQEQPKQKPADRSKLLNAAKNFPQVEGGKYLITGVRKTRTMQRGDNLYRMARQEYGDKAIVEYIKVLNQFPNPDNIPLGYEVKLPELLEKGE